MKAQRWMEGVAASLAVCSMMPLGKVAPLPTFSNVRQIYRSSDVALLARDGTLLDELRADHSARRLAWVDLGDVSPRFVEALIATEDRRFFGHPGVDVWAASHAATGPFRSGPRRGASTISMQLVGSLLKTKAKGRRGAAAKIRQFLEATELERRWKKAQILEAYINLVAFRGELVGVGAAARTLFGKDPSGLDFAESLLLTAQISQPNASAKRLTARACQVASRVGDAGLCLRIKSLAAAKLYGGALFTHASGEAPHAVRRLLTESSEGTASGFLRSTLDASLQRFANAELRAQIGELVGRHVRDAAALVVDNASGEILAYVGSSGPLSRSPEVDGVRARRQAGSILKPFLYEMALEKRYLTAASLLDDSPLELPVGGGVYRPKNYDNVFRGPVSVRQALAASLNVPAVKVLGLVGVEPYMQRLWTLGFNVAQRADFFGPSLALGAVDVSLEELVGAYRTLALRGQRGPLSLRAHAVPAGPPQPKVLAPAATYVVADILADRGARAMTFGLENYLATSFYTSVKTGTSKDMRDNWCVGFSDRYTVGVWVGNFDGEPMWNVSGVSGAAPIWMKLMRRLHESAPSRMPPPPEGVAEHTLRGPAGKAEDEWFVDGTAPSSVNLDDDPAVTLRLTYPTDGLVVAFDPDIDPARQQLRPEVQPASARFALRLDGRPLASGAALPVATLTRGVHKLTLLSPSGEKRDEVHFTLGGGSALSSR